ncbi:MAG: hypothetical protein J7L66_00900 [Anaerolineaceae bacterium]|nr:hypothetical protein [Anaerolineaceae bacterium]
MDEKIVHRPAIKSGVVFHLGILSIFGAVSGYLLWLSMIEKNRGFFILYLIASIITFIPFPYFLYQLVALLRAKYTLSREGMSIQWGLRTEDIPITDIEWLRLPEDFITQIPLPRNRMPGALLGTSLHRDLGQIEFIASETKQLVFIATRQKIFAISPRDIPAFISDFYHSAELGSITPIKKQSSRPQFIISSLLKDGTARTFLLTSAAVSLILLIVISFIIPSRESVPLGLEAVGVMQKESSSERLILLPLLSLFVFFIDFGFGSYLYRKKGFRSAAYIVFASSLILPISFSALLIMILLST